MIASGSFVAWLSISVPDRYYLIPDGVLPKSSQAQWFSPLSDLPLTLSIRSGDMIATTSIAQLQRTRMKEMKGLGWRPISKARDHSKRDVA